MRELLEAIQHGRSWLDSFSRLAYRNVFGQYRARYELLYVSAVQACESVEGLANEILDGLENDWKKERFWNRKAAQTDDKMMLIAYLTPMLLGAKEPLCASFAQALCAAWNGRFPKNTYEVADYDTINSGFRSNLLDFNFNRGSGKN